MAVQEATRKSVCPRHCPDVGSMSATVRDGRVVKVKTEVALEAVAAGHGA